MQKVSMLLVNVIEDHVSTIRHDYSGRGMFGEKCFAFVADNPEAAIGEIFENINKIYQPEDLRNEFTILIQHSRYDSMGFQQIVYFPGYQTNETNKKENEDE